MFAEILSLIAPGCAHHPRPHEGVFRSGTAGDEGKVRPRAGKRGAFWRSVPCR
jgi:hypothetical protein